MYFQNAFQRQRVAVVGRFDVAVELGIPGSIVYKLDLGWSESDTHFQHAYSTQRLSGPQKSHRRPEPLLDLGWRVPCFWVRCNQIITFSTNSIPRPWPLPGSFCRAGVFPQKRQTGELHKRSARREQGWVIPTVDISYVE